MRGTDAVSGRSLSGEAHLRQSIADILRTPIGSRVMRRDYGSRLFALVDSPMSQGTIAAIHGAVAEALAKWEPRFRLRRSGIVSVSPGTITLDLFGDYLDRAVTIEGVTV